MNTKTIASTIRKQRKDKKLTLVTVANHCNVGVRFLSELENGKPTIEIGKALKVMQRLNIELTVVPTGDVQKDTYKLSSAPNS